MRDVNDVIGQGENAIITSGDLGFTDYVKLIQEMDYPKLGDYLHHKYPGQHRGQRGREGLPGRVHGGLELRHLRPHGQQEGHTATRPRSAVGRQLPRCRPATSVPTYITDNPRFKISVGQHARRRRRGYPGDYYGTKDSFPAYLYSEDGRYVAGPYDTNLSGDTWVADAAIKIMENENWSGSG